MPVLVRNCLLIVIVSLIASPWAYGQAAVNPFKRNPKPDAGSAPAAPDQGDDGPMLGPSGLGVAMAKSLLEKNLELSTGPNSAADQFQFVMRIIRKFARGETKTTQIDVIRDRSKGAILVSHNGVPYCLMTKDLLVAQSIKTPGALLMYTAPAANPGFELTGERGDPLFKIGFGRDFPKPSLVLAPGVLLKQMVPKATRSNYEPATRWITIETADNTAQVLLAARDFKGPIPMERMSASTFEGVLVDVTISPERTTKLNLFNISMDELVNMGVPIRSLSEDEVDANAISLLPPMDFGKEAGHVNTGKTLMKFLAPKGTTMATTTTATTRATSVPAGR